MQTDEFFKKLRYFVLNNKADSLEKLMKKNRYTQISQKDFFDFIFSFNKKLQKRLVRCININGSGGSGIVKLNLTSLASIYVAAISRLDVVKTGSRANTGLCGSTDFFEAIGLLNVKKKLKAINRYHFAYFDYLELSPWKKYKDLLKINKTIELFLDNIVFFEYQAALHGLGLSNPEYLQKMCRIQTLRFPQNIFTFYTKLQGDKYIDEVCAGEVFLNDKFVTAIMSENYFPTTKSEILQEDIKLLNGCTTNTEAYTSLKYSVAIYLLGMKFVDKIESSIHLFEEAYSNKLAYHLVENIKNDCN